MFCIGVLALAVVVWTTRAAHGQSTTPFAPAPAPAGDPRLGQIRAAIQVRGIAVLGVEMIPPQGSMPRIWNAITKATYVRADPARLDQQARDIWEVLLTILAQEEPATYLSGTQVWNKYAIIGRAHLADFLTLAAATNNIDPRSPGALDRITRAEKAFYAKVQVFVYDLEQRQFVDEKDFLNKHFNIKTTW
jgi:hypothetical protein